MGTHVQWCRRCDEASHVRPCRRVGQAVAVASGGPQKNVAVEGDIPISVPGLWRSIRGGTIAAATLFFLFILRDIRNSSRSMVVKPGLHRISN